MSWLAGLRMTPHAIERQREMKLSDAEVARAIHRPEQTYQDARGEIRQAGRIAVAVKRGHVLTVLWRTTEHYSRKDAS